VAWICSRRADTKTDGSKCDGVFRAAFCVEKGFSVLGLLCFFRLYSKFLCLRNIFSSVLENYIPLQDFFEYGRIFFENQTI